MLEKGLTFEEELTFDRLQLTEVVLVGLESLSRQASDSLQMPGHFRHTSTARVLVLAEWQVPVGTSNYHADSFKHLIVTQRSDVTQLIHLMTNN